MKTRSALFFLSAVSAAMTSVLAQEAESQPKRVEFVESRPYNNKTYDGDRGLTGAIFRKLRRIRAAEGNRAAAARLHGAWKVFEQRRIDEKWHPETAFDTWGFWAWHEAQYDTGKDDPEWAMLLYRSIYDIAKESGKMDWVFHVRVNLMNAYHQNLQWAYVRELANEAEDYFKGIGFDLDPQRLPDQGVWDSEFPFVRNREFPVMVPNMRHVVAWQRREQKNPNQPGIMDNILVSLIAQLACEDYNMGRWDRAMERFLWVRKWAAEVPNLKSKKKKKLSRDHQDAYRDASYFLAKYAWELGFNEKAIEIIDDALTIQGASRNEMRDQTRLEIMRDRLMTPAGKEDAALYARMENAIAREGKSPSIGVGYYDSARFVQADCLVTMGRYDEAEALLRGVCKRLDRRFSGALGAELKLVDFLLIRGRLDEAEQILREMVDFVRVKGVKLDELGLYMRYTEWAMLSGKWEEALRSQREVMRLLESFRMVTLMPYAHARMARIMAELGDREESDRLAELARSESTGRREGFRENVEDILRKIPAVDVVKAKSKVMMQPLKVMSAALEGYPSRAAVSLMNQGGGEAKGVLSVKGLPAKVTWDEKSRRGVIEVSDAPQGAAAQSTADIRIDPGALALFSCVGNLVNEDPKTVILEWLESGQVSARCEWVIEAADRESAGAVIDAGAYANDAFFMIPVYHHLQSKVSGPVNLRVVISQPCRVELYDEQGALQMVDAEGNGSLQNSGDWLGVDRDRNLSADVMANEGTGETQVMMLLDPVKEQDEKPLMVRVEWLIDGKWYLAAEDQVILQK